MPVIGFTSFPVDRQFARGQLSQFERAAHRSLFSILAGGNFPKTVAKSLESGVESSEPVKFLKYSNFTKWTLFE